MLGEERVRDLLVLRVDAVVRRVLGETSAAATSRGGAPSRSAAYALCSMCSVIDTGSPRYAPEPYSRNIRKISSTIIG